MPQMRDFKAGDVRIASSVLSMLAQYTSNRTQVIQN